MMSETEMNVAVTQARGWTKHTYLVDDEWSPDDGKIREYWKNAEGKESAMLDYGRDLDAMHEVEETLDDDKGEQMDYARNLRDIVESTPNRTKNIDFWFWHANASQRREAFLKTRGLWKD